MARNSGFFNRVLNFIGLVDDEPAQPNGNETRRVQPGDARARYGTTSSATSYSRDRQSAGSYGSSGRTAQYTQRAYDEDARTSYSRQGAYSSNYNPSSFERPSGSATRRQTEEVDELDFDYQEQPRQKPSRAPSLEQQRMATRRTAAPANTAPVRQQDDSDYNGLQITFLRTLDDCRDVINNLLENKTVVLNMEDLDDRISQRAIDTLGGAAFALGATLRRVDGRTYLIAPLHVNVAYSNDAGRR